MVDCTWDDLGEGHSPSYSFFGLSESNSNQSRTPATNVKGKDFQTTLPTLNSSNLIFF